MTGLLQMVFDLWTPTVGVPADVSMSENEERNERATTSPVHPNEAVVRYTTLIELRRLLRNFPEPERTTVLLVVDSDHAVHLPSLLERDEYAFRLIMTTSAGSLYGTTSAADLALHARRWGWCSIAFERNLTKAVAEARESTLADERLLVVLPGWLRLQV